MSRVREASQDEGGRDLKKSIRASCPKLDGIQIGISEKRFDMKEEDSNRGETEFHSCIPLGGIQQRWDTVVLLIRVFCSRVPEFLAIAWRAVTVTAIYPSGIRSV
jgi:hypothetical protein